MAPGKVRQRAWKPKNRTGCKTCKIRKVKCDEEKPFCKRCTSTGRTCDGYDPTFRPPGKSPSLSPPQPPSRSGNELVRAVSPMTLAPALRFNSAQERDSFDFFTTYAISSLRGFVDSPFWQREILQAAHQHESIQHCVVALGAMHRRFLEGSESNIREADLNDEKLQFALGQSNQAIQSLIKAAGPRGKMTGVDRVTLMTCCVLFSSMACLQGHQKEGLQHLKSGIRMLNEMDEDESIKVDSHPIDVESLRSIFVGLDMQARSILKAADLKAWGKMPRPSEATILQDAELSDESILAVQRYLLTLYNRALVFLQDSLSRSKDERESVYHEYRQLLARFDHSTLLLDRLCAKASYTTGDFKQPMTAVQLLHAQLEFFLRAPRPDLDKKFDITSDPLSKPFDTRRHFSKLLELAAQLLPHTNTLAPVFTTSTGPLSALWLVATRAPSECTTLRKRAVRLMLSYPRREGFWDGLMAGQIAQEVLRLEQESTQEELGLLATPTRDLIVPDDLRIVIVAISYDEDNDRQAKIEYKNLRDVAAGGPGSVQLLHW